MNARGVVALVAVASVLAGCTSRTGGEAPDAPETTSAAMDLEDMLTETEAAAETLNTIDATDIEGSLDEWESVVTGDLLTDFQENRDEHVASLTTAGTSSEGETLAAAATEFDGDEGAAEVLVAMTIKVTQPGADPTEKKQRLRVGVTMTDDGWKIDSVETVPYEG